MSQFEPIFGEALEVMSRFENNSFDLICTDLPYGTTKNKWDIPLPLEAMWEAFDRILPPTGVVALTATQPFSSLLVASNLKAFKYEVIWEKTLASGQLNVHHQPLRAHESILIFSRKRGTYNEQKTEGKPYNIKRKGVYQDGNYGEQTASEKNNTGYRHARSVLKIPNPRIKGGHPTQKPVALMEWIVKTYSNPNDRVLDCCMGSGTTGVACLNWDREFVGIENDATHFQTAKTRLEEHSKQIQNQKT